VEADTIRQASSNKLLFGLWKRSRISDGDIVNSSGGPFSNFNTTNKCSEQTSDDGWTAAIIIDNAVLCAVIITGEYISQLEAISRLHTSELHVWTISKAHAPPGERE